MPVNGQEQCGAVNERVVRGLSWGLNDNWTPKEGCQPGQYPHPENERGLSRQTQQGCRRESPPISPVPGQMKEEGRSTLRSGLREDLRKEGHPVWAFLWWNLVGVGE